MNQKQVESDHKLVAKQAATFQENFEAFYQGRSNQAKNNIPKIDILVEWASFSLAASAIAMTRLLAETKTLQKKVKELTK